MTEISVSGLRSLQRAQQILPLEIIKNFDIKVIPVSFSFEGNIYRYNIDITHEDFYSLLKNSKEFPAFIPPDKEVFHTLFDNIITEKDILAIFQSGKTGNTFEYADSVRKENYNHYLSKRQEKYADEKDIQIELIDSQTASLGMGLLVKEAAEKIEKGWGIKELKDYIKNLIPKIRVVFVANEIFHSDGDSGNIIKSGFLINKMNKLLGIHPIFSIWNGELIPVDQIRGEKNACYQAIELIKESLESPDMPIRAGIIHADAPERAEEVRNMLAAHLNCQDIIISYMGPTFAACCGQGSVGVACLPLSKE